MGKIKNDSRTTSGLFFNFFQWTVLSEMYSETYRVIFLVMPWFHVSQFSNDLIGWSGLFPKCFIKLNRDSYV